MPQFLQGFGLCLYRKLTGLGSTKVLSVVQMYYMPIAIENHSQ